ncbi:uncharacterized protein TM35_000311080 [Trypanosoma theileri]|uniref:Uncharacterized protein n=1 Tax=Trypanosoma theileri TaxID=67003 RepID=A0A1X0NMF5_9TRYP|nr:uncharacterized protein TM35_000311080 [Trypanosoma theileri]ORC85922.1 hypothetical protein TM35_000311080 [Trypanosoma theileri]
METASVVAAPARLSRAPPVALATLEKSGYGVFSHPVTVVRTVDLPCGCVTVAAGANVVSVGLLTSLTQQESTQRTSSSLPEEVRVCKMSSKVESLFLSSGMVISMSLSLLPGAGAVLGVVGTSNGSLCVFILESRVAGGESLRLFKVCELGLSEYTDGLISLADNVLDVGIGFDPAGRPEFITAATTTCVVVLDTQYFDESLKANATEAVIRVFRKQKPYTHQQQSSQQHQYQHQQQQYVVVRPPSEAFYVTFAAAEVVRVLVPERYHAAFAVDVALVIVLDNGEVRYVERHVVGGSLQLLLQHHEQRQSRRSAVGLTMIQDEEMMSNNKEDPRTLPHVLYAYSLSAVTHNVCVAVVGPHVAAHVIINDAAFYYDSSTQQMELVLIGAEMQFTERSGETCGTAGWWAIAHGVVYARDTLRRFQEQQHNKQQQQKQKSRAHSQESHPLASFIKVSGFAGQNSGTLPRDGRGLSTLLVTQDTMLLLFASGNELHVCTLSGAGSGSRGSLRHVYSAGSVITSMASAEARGAGKYAFVIACGSSITHLLL